MCAVHLDRTEVVLTADSSSAVPKGQSSIMAMPLTEVIMHDKQSG